MTSTGSPFAVEETIRLIKDLSEKRREILNIDKKSFALAMGLAVSFNIKI